MDEKKKAKGISVKKSENFSSWYSDLVQKAELADLRYNIKGFVCYMPWAVMSIKKMYEKYEKEMEDKGHLPLTMPSLIPESNFHLEAQHVEGFAPEVFWVTEHGDGERFEEKLALRPTSETALYKMYSKWIRSYNDLPFKRYQSCQVWRYEGKMTRPFLRAREFHWIEAHNVFESLEDAKAQVIEDMEITYSMLQDEFAIPIIFFQRPEWDKFPGAVHTYASDALLESGKVIQLPSTHLLGQNFSKPFDVSFTDKDGKKQYGYITCYGPAISRIYGAMISVLGDDQGLVLPFDLAPVQIVIVPIITKDREKDVDKRCKELQKIFKGKYSVRYDDRDLTAGEKFNEWELKGVPIRIEIGPKDLEKDQAAVKVRNRKKKEFIPSKDLKAYVDNIAHRFTDELKSAHAQRFDSLIKRCEDLDSAKKAIDSGKIVASGICSIGMDGYSCAEKIEKKTGGLIRGTKVTKDKEDKIKFKTCIGCNKQAGSTVYIAKSY